MRGMKSLCFGLALLALGLLTPGCLDERRSCDASKELDFSPLKGMAGTWKETRGTELLIDSNGRPHSFDQGLSFGCRPGQFPLVLNDPTYVSTRDGNLEITLVSARVESNHVVLAYDTQIGPSRVEARLLDAEHLELWTYDEPPEPPNILTRICDDLCDPKTGLPLDEESSE